MSESIRQQYERLQVAEVLAEHPDLRIVPSWTNELVLSGALSFRVTGPTGEILSDTYEIEIRIPQGFPQLLPRVRETGERIAEDYHKLEGDLLCLGAPTAVRMTLTKRPTLPALVNSFVIPYLYGYSFFEKHGWTPYGELPHGDEGIREYLAGLFEAMSSECPEEFLRLAGMKKRFANKQPCPCGSGRRLGRCHNRSVNRLRRKLGRQWFQAEYERMLLTLMPPRPSRPGDAREWRKRQTRAAQV